MSALVTRRAVTRLPYCVTSFIIALLQCKSQSPAIFCMTSPCCLPRATSRYTRPMSSQSSSSPLPAVHSSSSSVLQAPPLWRRMACWLYEGVLLFGVVFITGYLFSALTQTRSGTQNRHALQGFMFLMLGIYFAWFWSKGQTLAMKTWHIRVTDRTGKPIAQWRALLRYMWSWLWFLPPLAALYLAGTWKRHGGLAIMLLLGWVLFWALLTRLMPGRQFAHDLMAGTRLISQEPPKDAESKRKWWQL